MQVENKKIFWGKPRSQTAEIAKQQENFWKQLCDYQNTKLYFEGRQLLTVDQMDSHSGFTKMYWMFQLVFSHVASYRLKPAKRQIFWHMCKYKSQTCLGIWTTQASKPSQQNGGKNLNPSHRHLWFCDLKSLVDVSWCLMLDIFSVSQESVTAVHLSGRPAFPHNDSVTAFGRRDRSRIYCLESGRRYKALTWAKSHWLQQWWGGEWRVLAQP